MNYDVRDAMPSDYGFVCKAFGKVNQLHCSMQPDVYRVVDHIGPKWQFCAVTLGTHLSIKPIKEKFCIKIAEYDGEPVGVVFAESVPRSSLSWSAFPKVANIENITASLEHRSKGAIEALLDATENWARDTGYSAMSGKISSVNSRSLSMAESAGFVTQSVNVGKRLG